MSYELETGKFTMQTKKNLNCGQVHKNLLDFIDGSLAENVNFDIKNHIGYCEQCYGLYLNVKETYTAYEKEPVPILNPFFSTRVLAKLHNIEVIETNMSHKLLRIFQPIAASVLIIIGISAGIYLGKNLAGSKTIVSVNILNNETLETYASEYYLYDLGEQSVSNLIDNE